jgi:dTDP-4-dehydrorhamnose reductase
MSEPVARVEQHQRQIAAQNVRTILSIQEHPLELWGGVECTINRVGAVFFDQLAKSGHRDRVESDLALFRDLGITTLRTAVHWERYEATQSWNSFDLLLAAMDRHSLRPIVGLLHHGSGPPSTNLLDPEFPEKLAAFALKVAQRYPSVSDYTPVNEPQTTGRFACLYGHWYPHHRSMKSYIRALFHEIKGVVLAMRAIRTVNPDARFIHTEDGGAIFSTSQLEPIRVQREHRRWLGVDLLCGRVTREHALFSFLVENGLTEAEILWFSQNACPPSVLGLNYYVTSDRFLDHRLELYPSHFAGGDTGAEPLVDFEAVRVRRQGIGGVGAILSEAWERYGIPVAITEAHLGCEPEEQIRWLAEIWQEAKSALASGVDVRAVTVWALLGSFNWCHLCTQDTNEYEAGVFDLVTGSPAETPLARLVSDLGHGRSFSEYALERRGWWHDADKFSVPPLTSEAGFSLDQAVRATRELVEL